MARRERVSWATGVKARLNLFQSVRIALEMLRMHKLRAFLTMLGVIIGVMSVTIIVMVSSGFQDYLNKEFKKLGSNTLWIVFDPGRRDRGESLGNLSGLKMDDLEYLRTHVSQLGVMAPVMQVPTQKVLVADRTLDNPRIYAGDQYYLELTGVELQQGRLLNPDDQRDRANVCLIGEEIRDTLFPDHQPLGKYISFKDITLQVVGVFKKQTTFGESNAKDVVLPISTAQDKWIGGDTLMMISARTKPGVSVDIAMNAVWQAHSPKLSRLCAPMRKAAVH